MATAPWRSDKQRRFDDPAVFLGDRLVEGSLYRLSSDHGHRLFGDEYFADPYLASKKGRPTVPTRVPTRVLARVLARVPATIMVLQGFERLSDREAIDRLGAEVPGEVDDSETDAEPTVVGDAAYGDGATLAKLRAAGVEVIAKLAPVGNLPTAHVVRFGSTWPLDRHPSARRRARPGPACSIWPDWPRSGSAGARQSGQWPDRARACPWSHQTATSAHRR